MLVDKEFDGFGIDIDMRGRIRGEWLVEPSRRPDSICVCDDVAERCLESRPKESRSLKQILLVEDG